MTSPITNAMDLLREFGYFEVILPMILIFAIFYALILKTNILGKYKEDTHVKGLAALISFAAAFLVVSYTPVVQTLVAIIPTASLLLVITLLIMLILVFVGVPIGEKDPFGEHKWLWVFPAIIVFVIFLALIDVAAPFEIPGIHQLVLAFTGQLGGSTEVITIDPNVVNIIIALIIFLVVPIVIIGIIVGKTGSE